MYFLLGDVKILTGAWKAYIRSIASLASSSVVYLSHFLFLRPLETNTLEWSGEPFRARPSPEK